MRELSAIWLGRRAYGPVLELQERLLAARREDRVGDVVLLLEHTPVVTLGRGAHLEHVLLGEEALRARGVELATTGRGGDVTVHGPGQLVAYPIVKLAPERCDVRRWVGDLRETMARVAAAQGVDGGELPGKQYIGFWADAASPGRWPGGEQAARPVKLGAIGVRLSSWTSCHGFALNLSTDLSLFSLIVPCGISSLGVGSIEGLTGRAPTPRAAAQTAYDALAERLGARQQPLRYRDEQPLAQLMAELGLGADPARTAP